MKILMGDTSDQEHFYYGLTWGDYDPPDNVTTPTHSHFLGYVRFVERVPIVQDGPKGLGFVGVKNFEIIPGGERGTASA